MSERHLQPIGSGRIAATPLKTLISSSLHNPACAWSLGTFGAIAEFMYDLDEPVVFATTDDSIQANSNRGAIHLRFDDNIVPVAYETPSKAPDRWSHALALCLPRPICQGNRRRVLTELGPDESAVRPQDRRSVLFDLGLDTLQVDACVRLSDPALISRFRAWCGHSLFEPGNPLGVAMPEISPHRVFLCRFGRIEVFQPIPPPDGKSPEGPHTHLLPKLLRTGLTHPKTAAIPEGFVPCAHMHPPGPFSDPLGNPKPFDRQAYEDFQELLKRHGDPELLALKNRLFQALDTGEDIQSIDRPEGRHATATIKLAERQFAAKKAATPSG